MKHSFIAIANLALATLFIPAAVYAAPAQIIWTGEVLPDDPTTWTCTTNAYIGVDGAGSLTITNGGAISSLNGFIGSNSSSTGSVTVTGSGSVWSNSEDLYVGYCGDGTLTVEDGGALYSAEGHIGRYSGSSGTVTVTGSGSIWTNASYLSVPRGTLTVADGGALYNSDGAYITGEGSFTPAVTVTGTGSVWTNFGELSVGQSGPGTLTVADGGAVYNISANIGTMPGAQGAVTVMGTDSVWTTSGRLSIGVFGDGTLTVKDGGAVYNADGFIGYDRTGLVTVTGTNSVWVNSGKLSVGRLGDGALTVEDGGRVDIGSDLSVYSSSSITFASGGRLHVGGDATLALGSLLSFVLSQNDGSGQLNVDGTLYNEGATLKISSTEYLEKCANYELISAGSISNAITNFDANDILSVYKVALIQTSSNVTATVLHVKKQATTAPSMTQAGTASANMTMNRVSKYSSIARSLFRGGTTPDNTPYGPAGPESGLVSGEWAGYLRQFNDLGGQDSDGAVDGYDWNTSGYLLGMEKRVIKQLVVGFGAGQAWTDLDGSNDSDGGASEMVIASLYGNWFNDAAYCEFGLLYAAAENETTRTDTALDYYTGDYDSEMFGAWLENGYRVRATETTAIEPYIRSTYVSGHQDEYTDAGGPSPMTISANNTDNWQVEGGARLNRKWRFEQDKTLKLELKAGAQCELLDTSVTVNTLVAGASQRAASPDADRVAVILGARADWGLNESLNIGLGYEPTFAGNWQNHLIDFTLKYHF